MESQIASRVTADLRFPIRTILLLAIWLAFFTCSVRPLQAQGTPSGTKAAADDGAAAAPKAIVPLPREADLVLSPSPCQFAVLGQDVFDLTRKTKSGTISALPKSSSTPRALSPNGKYFACQNESDNVMFVEIHDCEQGKKLHEFRYTTEKFQRVELLRFTRHNNLIVAAPASGKLGVFVVQPNDAKKLKELTVERVDANKLGVSEDGRYLAVGTTQGLTVYEVVQGKPVAKMEEPATQPKLNPFIFSRGFYFSPDNKELAGLFALNGFRLVVWDQQGKIKEDHALGLRIGGAYNQGAPVEWSPDAKGWLLHGNFYFDRRLKSIGWLMTGHPSHNYHHVWLDNDHVISTRGDFQNRELVSVAVPRGQIEAGALAIESGQEALLRPGQQISVAVEVGSTRFADRNSITTSLQELLTKRFAEGGITVTAGQPKILKVFYSEAQGEELEVVEGRPGPRGRPTGQKVQETVLILNAKLVAPGEAKPVWETNIRRGNPRIIRAQSVNDAEVRKATFQMLEYLLSSTPIPFFVPADPNAPRLPLLTGL